MASIIIPDNVTSLGREALYDCDALTSVTVGNGMTSIGNAAFYDCDALTSITIGDGITEIPDSLCAGCNKLDEVRIGKSVKSIGILAFYINDGYSIEKFYCHAPLPPKFSNNEKYIGETSRPNAKPGYLMRIYHDYYPFYYRATNYEVKSDYSTGKILNTKDFKTVIQTLYVPVRCSTVYKESDWEEHFSYIVEI